MVHSMKFLPIKLYTAAATVFLALSSALNAQKLADKPLFRDPIYDGAADPVIIWNTQEKMYNMFYTNRRAKLDSLPGVSWVHGTDIGIARSVDGAHWEYIGTCNFNYEIDSVEETFWAPDVVFENGVYHMYVSIVPGVFEDWYHPRYIAHFTSKNLVDWQFQSKLKLSSERCIDASVFKMPNGVWRMYYNNENDNKSIYYADSKDLYNWKDGGEKVINTRGEGAKVFSWKGKNWMIIDSWNGLTVFQSKNFTKWERQEERILEKPGFGNDDMVKGSHADVVVQNDKAFIFYFTHPGKTQANKKVDNYTTRRSSIQVAELIYEDGKIKCKRDAPVYIELKKD